MAFSWTINVGEILTILTLAGSFIYFLGRTKQRVEGIAETQDEHYQAFRAHEEQDLTRFENLNRNLQAVTAAMLHKGD